MTPAHNPDSDSSVWYREDHCVLRWPMVTAGMIAPVAVIAIFVLGVVLQSAPLLVAMLIPIIFWIARGQLLLHWWPIGIRLRPDRVAIGGVRWAERHTGKRHRKASVLNQGYQVFSCPWDGVIWMWVETDPERLKDLRRHATYGRKPTPLGNLSVPFMTAALVIRVDPAVATVPAIHNARNPLAANYSSPGYHQDRWAVPTRHPDRLRKALASLPLPPGVVIDPDTVDWSLGPDPQSAVTTEPGDGRRTSSPRRSSSTRRFWHPRPVSPVSRGRKSAKRRQPSRIHPSGKNRLREPGLQAARDLFVASLTGLLDQREVPGASDAEIGVSVLLGKLIQPRMSNSAVIGCLMDVIDELKRCGEDYSYPALRALAVIGPPEIGGYAASAAGRVAGTADGVPPWVPGLGNVVPGKCLLATEPFGEQQVLSCEFTYADGTQPHSVWAVFDAAWHGAATTLVVTDELEKARRTLEKDVRKLDAEFREIPAAEAAAMLLLGIEAFVTHGPPPGTSPLRDERYAEACATVCIAHHRATVLLGPDGKVAAPDDAEARWPAEEREKLVAEFLASPQARNLRDGASWAMPGMLITSCVSQMGCEPDLIGPELLDRLLMWVIPGTILAPDHFGELIPPVIRAWTQWLAQRRGLDGNARKKLTSRLSALLRQFPARWNGPVASPLRRYVQDVPDDEAYRGDVIMPLLERRTFAVPEPEDRPEGFSEARGAKNAKKTRRNRDLDAADPDDREVITMHDASARGVPVQRFGACVTVVEQLWANDPPEAWEAAQRLQQARLSRGKIMDKLARAYDTSSPEAYPAALSRLSP